MTNFIVSVRAGEVKLDDGKHYMYLTEDELDVFMSQLADAKLKLKDVGDSSQK